MGIDMLLIDSQSTMMPATVNVNRLATHQPNLEAGSVYSLSPRTPVTCSEKQTGFVLKKIESLMVSELNYYVLNFHRRCQEQRTGSCMLLLSTSLSSSGMYFKSHS